LEQRGLAVISTSGVLVSLLFGFGAVTARRSEALDLPTSGRLLLVTAVVAFVIGAGFGLATNAPKTYAAIAQKALDSMITEDLWIGEEEPASRNVAKNKVKLVRIAREQNKRKAGLLQWALRSELVGVALVAASVADLLLHR